MTKQNKENGKVPDFEAWEKKTFTQERDFFKKKLEDLEDNIAKNSVTNESLLIEGKINKEEIEKQKKRDETVKKFFEKKLQQVEHDLFIINKNKFDLSKFSTYA